MRRFRSSWSRIAVIGLLICALLAVAPASAAPKSNSKSSTQNTSNSKPNISSALTHSYNADPAVQVGMVVELKAKDPNTVVPLPASDIANLLGIVIPANNATIVLTPQSVQQQQVLVATSGRYDVLVSTQNGAIKAGDYLTISAISGVAMKSDITQAEVIGQAAGNFSGTTDVISSLKLKDNLGHQTNVSIGRVPLDINISHNPLYAQSVDYVPGFFSKIAVAVANKPVGAARIYLCLALLFLTAMVTGNMLYSGVRSGMIAVGRNPLSKKSIMKSLIETVIAGLIIFVAGIFAVYLLLKL